MVTSSVELGHSPLYIFIPAVMSVVTLIALIMTPGLAIPLVVAFLLISITLIVLGGKQKASGSGIRKSDVQNPAGELQASLDKSQKEVRNYLEKIKGLEAEVRAERDAAAKLKVRVP